jgi:large subunit ribosomal protein L18
MSAKSPQVRAAFRKLRTRRKIYGTPERPRLSVHRSSKHIYAQLVDDVKGATLAAVSSVTAKGKSGATIDAARTVGQSLGEKAKSLNIQAVVFDRGGRPYHGRIKAVADGARAAGLQF